MELLFFCPRWGSENIPWDVFLKNVKQEGFDGVETGLPENEKDAERLLELFHNYNLKYILQHYETDTSNFNQHKKSYLKHLKRLAAKQPYLINSHTGRDFFLYEQNVQLLEEGRNISDQNNTIITHETHRSRFSFAAHVTDHYLIHNWLKLTWDVSHWFCVAETLLEDQETVIKKIIPHIYHIHARIGHTQGPQIDDIKDKKWYKVIERHISLWEKVIYYHSKKGRKEFGITTEFGPWPYMFSKPSGKESSQHQFGLNIEMMKLLKAHFKKST